MIFGGSFSPVHLGHVAVVRGLLSLPGVPRVLVVPAGVSPFKQDRPPLPASLRWRMLQAALGGLPGVSLWDLELRRPGPSYTVQTVAALHSLLPQARLSLAMGWDTLHGFARWHQAATLLEMAGLLVVPRRPHAASSAPPPADAATLLPAEWQPRLRRAAPALWSDPHGRPVLELVDIELPAIAASQILEQAQWESVPAPARELLLAYQREQVPAGSQTTLLRPAG